MRLDLLLMRICRNIGVAVFSNRCDPISSYSASVDVCSERLSLVLCVLSCFLYFDLGRINYGISLWRKSGQFFSVMTFTQATFPPVWRCNDIYYFEVYTK